MGTLVRLQDFRQGSAAPFFDRRELRAILAFYAERVARGEWRDYAIEQQQRYAGFAVFRLPFAISSLRSCYPRRSCFLSILFHMCDAIEGTPIVACKEHIVLRIMFLGPDAIPFQTH